MTQPTTSAAPPPGRPDSPLAPLRHGAFRSVWSALAGSQFVIWMNTVGAVTVVASLSNSATLLALVHAANSAAAMMFALIAGAIADIVDRRRMALAFQALMLAAVSAMAVLTFAGAITPAGVLLLTFALGTGMSASFVVYQALTPDIVTREELPAAVALNSAAINIARAAGPALAGLVIAAASAAAVFAVEAALVLAIMAGVFLLRAPLRPAREPEGILTALRTGGRFIRFSTPVRAVLARIALFCLFASALWALLPVVALGPLGLDSGGFGLLLGCVGAGAVTGAVVVAPLRRRVSADVLITAASAAFGAALAVLAYLRNPHAAAVVLVGTGVCWFFVITSLSTATQQVAPAWVRARTLSSFQVVMQSALAVGSLVWGLMAGGPGTRTALLVAAVGLIAGTAGVRRWPLSDETHADPSPAPAGSAPELALEPGAGGGPVLVTVKHRVDEAEPKDPS